MKQIGILLKETDKMKRLMSIKNDKVILKEAPLSIDDWVRGFQNSAGDTTIDHLSKMDKPTFVSFMDTLKSKTGQDFNYHINTKFDSSDGEEVIQLQNLLKSKFNIDSNNGLSGNQYMRPRQRVFNKTFKITNANITDPNTANAEQNQTDAAAGQNVGSEQTGLTAKQKTINFEYCNVKNGKIENAKSSSNGITWQNYVSTYKITPEEIAVAKQTCPNVVVPNVGGGQTGPTPTQRFATTATSLGIQNPKMDVATLQTILNTLNQGGSGLTESKNSVNEELNKMKYILGYQRGRVISEQDAAQTQQAATQPAATPKDLIRQIQTVLKTKYNANLGKFGAKGDGIDEKWGNLTQTALENALKTIADVKQRRETETQQTTTQDTAIQQAAEKGRMEIPQTNNLPNLPGIQLGNQQKQDIYTTLVNNKTLLTRNQNTVIYNGPDLSSAQRNELEQSMSQKGYRISKDNRDFRSGDKIIFKKNQ
jgi:hypothetical protein